MRALKNYVGGAWTEARSAAVAEVRNPATGEALAHVPLSGAADVDAAVSAAAAAFPAWSATPPSVRARFLFKVRDLLLANGRELATICTTEHGKTLQESASDLGRGIENVEHACGIPALLMGESLPDIAPGIDGESFRRPLGVFAAITPFNFPPMVPLWFLPYAIACGNTFVLKPSEQTPLTQQRIFELIAEAGVPAGVVNLVNGAREVVDAFCAHPEIAGVSFVGSTAVARHVYATAAANGKRVQALGGAKNALVVMPDASSDPSVHNVCDSAFGCSGQRCLAGNLVIAVGEAYERVRDALLGFARRIRVGNGLEPGVTMGPVISARHRDRVLGFIEKGVSEGATLLLDGRDVKPEGAAGGFWIGPTLFDDVTPGMTIAREEIFGPVACILRARDLDEAIGMINASAYGNAASIFTRSGDAARAFRLRAAPGMIGVNVGVAAPMAFFSFGGTRASAFGDLKAHGTAAIDFYTTRKTVVTRWF